RGSSGGDHGEAARLRDREQPWVPRHVVGEDDGGGRRSEAEFDQALEPRTLERGDVRLLVAPEHLDAVRVDEIQMADECGRLGRILADDGPAARLAADPGEPQPLAVVLMEPCEAGLQHTVATR